MPCLNYRLAPLQTGRAAFPEVFAGGMHEGIRLAYRRNHRLGEPHGIGRLLGASSMDNDSPLTTIQIRQGPFARPALPGVYTTMNPSDSPRGQEMVIGSHQLLAGRNTSSVDPPRGVSQVPDTTIDACHPLSPRAAQRLRVPIDSPLVVGFAFSGRLATTVCVTRPNRVHAFALRLTSSPTPRLRQSSYPFHRPGGYMSNRQFTW